MAGYPGDIRIKEEEGELAPGSDAFYIKVEEEEEASSGVPIKEEREVILPFEVDDLNIKAEEMDCTPRLGCIRIKEEEGELAPNSDAFYIKVEEEEEASSGESKQKNNIIEAQSSKSLHHKKKHSCPFCSLLVYQMPRHLKRKHLDEAEVREALSASPTRKKNLLRRLMRKGDFVHNISIVTRKEGEFILVRGSNESNSNNYMPCPGCRGFFKPGNLVRHSKQCLSSPLKGKDLKHLSRSLLESDKCLAAFDPRFTKYIEASMKDDDIASIVKTESLILTVGPSQQPPKPARKDETDEDWEPSPEKSFTPKPKKESWTTPQKSAMLKYFATPLKRGKPPRQKEILEFMRTHKKIVKNKTWKQIKYFVHNRILKIKKKNGKSKNMALGH